MDWDNTSDNSLREVIVETRGRAGYDQMQEALMHKGVARSASSIRTRLYRLGLGKQTERVTFAEGARHEVALVKERPDLLSYFSDKAESEIDLDEVFDLLERAQEINHKASTHQDVLNSGFPEATKPIAVCQISDWHLASYGTDHRYARRFLQELESIPDLYLAIVGDMQSMQINLSQGVAACSDNILTPAMQHKFLETWLSRVSHRTLAATWDNHSTEREERGSGASMMAHIFSERVPYFNGLGKWRLTVGSQVYNILISHKLRGRSENNPCVGGMKAMRFQFQDCEIAMCGDSHVPGILRYGEGGVHRIAVNSGTLQASGYTKRFFSLAADKAMPVIQFFPDKHMAIPYWSVSEWLCATGRHELAARLGDVR